MVSLPPLLRKRSPPYHHLLQLYKVQPAFHTTYSYSSANCTAMHWPGECNTFLWNVPTASLQFTLPTLFVRICTLRFLHFIRPHAETATLLLKLLLHCPASGLLPSAQAASHWPVLECNDIYCRSTSHWPELATGQC